MMVQSRATPRAVQARFHPLPRKERMSTSEQPDWDAEITLREAAAISGLSYSYLRDRAAEGVLCTRKVGERLNVTTRRWLDDYLRARGSRGGGRGPAPKPLPTDYQAPPRRGRPPKAKAAAASPEPDKTG